MTTNLAAVSTGRAGARVLRAAVPEPCAAHRARRRPRPRGSATGARTRRSKSPWSAFVRHLEEAVVRAVRGEQASKRCLRSLSAFVLRAAPTGTNMSGGPEIVGVVSHHRARLRQSGHGRRIE